MKIEKVHNDIRYTLSNDNLATNDKVFPIAFGRCLDDNGWILSHFDFNEHVSGFPDRPHTIIDLEYNKTYKPEQIRTTHGFGPIEKYYKVIKMEKQVIENEADRFKKHKWVEISHPVS